MIQLAHFDAAEARSGESWLGGRRSPTAIGGGRRGEIG
jgi:hypothetical protein